MNKEFIPYEQALELKELGFDEDVIAYWEKNSLLKPIPMSDFINSFPVNDYPKADWTAAPLYQQAFRWFREKYSLVHCIGNPDLYPIKGENFHIGVGVNPIVFEEAELSCLKKLIVIAKTNNL